MTPPRVLLIRHAQSTWNAEGRMQGWADPPLSPAGIEQAEALGHRLGAEGPGAVVGVVSSDLARAARTAAILAEACGCPEPEIDARLREREIGRLTGLTDEEARGRYPEEVAAWREQRRPRPPGGESTGSVLGRARAAIDALMGAAGGREGGEVVVAVSHGGLISALEREAGAGPGGFSNLTGRWLVPGGPAGWQVGARFG
ncbi:MAG TPA: histidine phosphatase family protein [Acidimicrobiales bacterium]|nr:histidine phosphatase family protein [Acidimicrobiales bacterium]